MKKLIIFLLAISPGLVLACNKKVDPSKVILFLDTNTSDLEIETVRKAACERGEVVKVVPENYRDYRKYINELESAIKKISKCTGFETPACKKANEEFQNANTKYQEFLSGQPTLQAGLSKALEEIKASGGTIQNFTISGHDGGGHFGGHKGSVSRRELENILSGYQDINDAKSLLLLGCYTGTQHEVMEWKNLFPKAKLIGGYDGSAPLSDRPQGHKYISDLLLKEKQLSSQADNKKLQAFVNANFQGLNNLNAAMYVQCSDGSSIQEYYYGSKKSRNFAPLELQECINKKPELAKLLKKINKYVTGELEPPKDTQNGELRALYNQARAYEHCSEVTGIFLNVNAVFNLLFYEGVKNSFADYYKNDLAEAEKVINSISHEDLENSAREYLAQIEEGLNEAKADIEKFRNSRDEYFAEKEKSLKEFQDKLESMLNDPKYAQVKDINFAMLMTQQTQIPLGQEQNFAELMAARMAITALEKQITFEKTNPEETLQQKLAILNGAQQHAQNISATVASLKDPSRKIWVPTAENLKKRTRKELLENIHNIHNVLTVAGATGKGTVELSWVSTVTMLHLQAFDNPFSWHEFTGARTERPQRPLPLNNFREAQTSINSGAYFGGMGGTGVMYGPAFGTVGGFGGGI